MTTRRRKWALGTAAVAVLAMVAAMVATSDSSQDGTDTVSAYFADAGSLIPGNTVRANGVEIGEVVAVTLDHGKARVDMRLDPKALPLRADASATVRPVSLLGERYVTIDVGTPAAPAMPTPMTIPVERTKASVDLDQVLNTLDTPTSTALGALVTTLGEGMQGNGPDVAAAIKALEPAMTQTNDLVGVLKQQNDLIGTLIDQAAPVAAAVASNDGKTVDQLVGAADQTLSSVAANREMLDKAVAQLPATLRDTRETLQQLGGVADATTPALRSARPVTDHLTEISDELKAFTDAGSPALASLQPVLDHANDLLDQAAPVVSDLRKGSPDLRADAAGLKPLGTAALDNLDNLLRFITGWASATAGYDALGHFFRASVPIDSNTIKKIAPDLVPPELLGSLAGERVNPDPNRDAKDQANAPAPLLPAAPSDPGSATGLTKQQENSLQHLIFGGG